VFNMEGKEPRPVLDVQHVEGAAEQLLLPYLTGADGRPSDCCREWAYL
jgi:hypothetical protein